jgi:glycosyltransferase involved in cell wall biosynthesis
LAADPASESPDQAGWLENRFYELGLLPAACKVRLFRFPRIRDPRSLAVVYRIRQCIRNDEPNIVHILTGTKDPWAAVLANLLDSLPVVSTMIVPKPNVGESLPAFLIIAIYKLLAHGSEMVIVNGANQVELVHQLYRIPISRIAYIPLGPRTTAARWSRQKTAEEPGTILFFGKAYVHKGLEYLVRAQPMITQQLPQARILIVGQGSDLERCRSMIQDPSKFEIQEGFATGEATATCFQRASVVALPYISSSTSGILMTAYVFGKPVVATRVGCLPEYVKDGVTGLLVPPADEEQLGQAIIRLLSNHDLRQRMSKSAVQWVKEVEKDIAVQSLAVYDKAMGMHG